MIIVIQDVTGPHRQKDRDDRPCREDHFFVKEHILVNMSFLSYAHVSRCARYALEPTCSLFICAVSPLIFFFAAYQEYGVLNCSGTRDQLMDRLNAAFDDVKQNPSMLGHVGRSLLR